MCRDLERHLCSYSLEKQHLCAESQACLGSLPWSEPQSSVVCIVGAVPARIQTEHWAADRFIVTIRK